MEFDLTTFILESVNFIILVWLLKRFLYQPVLNVIAKRQAATSKTVADAKLLHTEAEALKNDYENKIAQIGKDATSAEEKLHEEIENERKQRLETLENDIAMERQRREALEESHQEERLELYERQALELGGRFVARLFERLSSPQLDNALADLAIKELENLRPEKLQALKTSLDQNNTALKVLSAYPLKSDTQASLTLALRNLTGQDLTPEFDQDTTLMAGIYITAGSWVLMANLRDELNFFTETIHHDL